MSKVFDDYHLMLSRLRGLIAQHSPAIVGVEGFMASGKSHLARRLAAEVDAALIELDACLFAQLYPDRPCDHLRREPYIDNLDLDHLSSKLTAALSEHTVVIIEGICLGDVLARLNRRADVTVYIKCLSRDTKLWHDGFHLEDYEDGTVKLRGPHHDEMEYHRGMRPHEKADLILQRLDE